MLAAEVIFPEAPKSEMSRLPKVMSPVTTSFVVDAFVVEELIAVKLVTNLFVEVELVVVALVMVALLAKKFKAFTFVDEEVVAKVEDAKIFCE